MAVQLGKLLDSIEEPLPAVLAPGQSCSLGRLGRTQPAGKMSARDRTGD